MKKISKHLNKRKQKSTKNSSDSLSVTLRDSGIVEDGDDSSETSSLNRASINFIPSRQVKNRIQCFEFLAQERGEFHTNPNWWLEEQKRLVNEEIEAKNEGGEVEKEEEHVEEEEKISHRTSLKSQVSDKSQHDEPETQKIPEITFDDAEDESDEDNKSLISENFEPEEDVEKEIEETFVRNSMNRIRMSRPASVNSQTSM